MTQTAEVLFGVSKDDWFNYEALRQSGVMNMWGSREVLGLSKEEFKATITHYSEMAAAWKEEFLEMGRKAGKDTRMKKMMHSCIAVSYIEARLREPDWRARHTRAEVQAWVKDTEDAKKKGYLYLPACDNIRADGHCAGHEE